METQPPKERTEAHRPDPGAGRDPARPWARLKPLHASVRGEVSLFPFMSILACLIGILSLLIGLSMAANQKKEGMTQEEVDRAQQYKSLQLLVQKKKAEIKPPDPTENKLTMLELEKLKALLAALRAELEKIKDVDLHSAEELKKRIKILGDEKLNLQKEQPVFQKKIDELNAKLAAMKEKPVPKESVRVKLPKLGTKMPRYPFFVECNSTGVVIRKPNNENVNITTAQLKAGSVEFRDFVEEAKRKGDYAIIFLVRRSGIESYGYSNAIAELDCKAKTSKLPMPNDGNIDLSAFRL